MFAQNTNDAIDNVYSEPIFYEKLLYGATSGEYIENTIAVGIGGKDSVLE